MTASQFGKPTDEQCAQFIEDALRGGGGSGSRPRDFYGFANRLARAAYSQGADDELNACVAWVRMSPGCTFAAGRLLLDARRPVSGWSTTQRLQWLKDAVTAGEISSDRLAVELGELIEVLSGG